MAFIIQVIIFSQKFQLLLNLLTCYVFSLFKFLDNPNLHTWKTMIKLMNQSIDVFYFQSQNVLFSSPMFWYGLFCCFKFLFLNILS